MSKRKKRGSGKKVMWSRRFFLSLAKLSGIIEWNGKKVYLIRNKEMIECLNKQFDLNLKTKQDFLNVRGIFATKHPKINVPSFKKRPKRVKRKPTERQIKYQAYLKSPEWAAIRLDLFESRGMKCERCESTKRLQVHHLTYKNIFKENPEDLEILCAGCHKAEHKIK